MFAARRGMTLIEIALAVTIGLALLIGSVYAYNQTKVSAEWSQAKTMVGTISTNIAMQKFRTGQPPTLAQLQSNTDNLGHPYWPQTNGVLPADPVSGSDSAIAQYSSASAAVAINPGDPQTSWDNPYFQTPGSGQGGWLYDPSTGSFRINYSNAQYPEQHPSTW